MEPKRVLVIANQSASSGTLRSEIARHMRAAPCRFTLVVPATPPHEHATYTESEAFEVAAQHLTTALTELRALGAEIQGTVGDANPIVAIADALLTESFDEIILSTLEPGASRWLKADLPHRIQRHFDIPLTVVISEPARAAMS